MQKRDTEKSQKSFWDPSNTADTAFDEYLDAWFSGNPVDGDTFIQARPECGESLRARIEDFLFVARGFKPKPKIRGDQDGEEDEPLQEGTVIGDYVLKNCIGRGGMGRVYKAEQQSIRRDVALKVLPPHLNLSGEAVLKFHREAEAGGRQRHPGIVAVYAAGEAEGVHYIVQELVEGGRTLADSIKETRNSALQPSGYFRIVARKITEAANALSHAHASGVIHRDVKPGNILLNREGLVKITDFGLARVEDALALSRSGDFAGTPFYMSPEQAEGHRHKVDARTDIYSLGVTLYEMLTLKRPFEGKTSQEVLSKILRSEPRDPRKVNTRVPRDLAVIAMKAMEKEPDRRYRTMDDLETDLRRFLAGNVILAKPAGPVERARKLIKRNPLFSTAAGIVLATLLFLLGYILLWSYPQAMAQTERITRLSDSLRISELFADEMKLWPSRPEKEAAIRAWIDRAKDLISRFPLHKLRFDELCRSAGLSHGDLEQQQDRCRMTVEELLRLKTYRNECVKNVQRSEQGRTLLRPHDRIYSLTAEEIVGRDARFRTLYKVRAERYDRRIAELESEFTAYGSARFEDRVQVWEFNKLHGIIRGLELLMDEQQGRLKQVERRLDFVRAMRSGTGEEAQRVWENACASILDTKECPFYHGFRMKPQTGLLPTGRDPDSGLWEFAHLESGSVPDRDADGRLIYTGDCGMVFVLIPGGTFYVGAIEPSEKNPVGTPYVDPEARAHELSWKGAFIEVTLQPFLLSKFEMTAGQWYRLTGRMPNQASWSESAHPLLHPVTDVTWDELDQVLSELDLRLCSESEWEYAARAGTTTPRWTGAERESLRGAENLADLSYADAYTVGQDEIEDWLDDRHASHAPVGCFKANAFGLHDMLGNVMEWTFDRHLWNYNILNTRTDGFRTINGTSSRIFRAGGWRSRASDCRVTRRDSAPGDHKSDDLGVRPAAVIE